MKNFKRIITLMLTLVMMMAMSVTAFAANANTVETVGCGDITVAGLKAEDTLVSIYEVATVNVANNTVIVNDWAKNIDGFSKNGEFITVGNDPANNISSVGVANIAIAVEGVDKVDSIKSNNESTVTFTGLKAGVYCITIKGGSVKYNPSVVTTFTIDAGVYKPAEAQTVSAKNTDTIVEKTTAEANKYVHAGEVIDFTITSEVPFGKSSFVIVDEYTNLKDITNVKVKVDGTEVDLAYTDEENKLTFDFKEFLNDTYAGKTIVITYSATVDGANGYVNTAYGLVNGEKSTPSEVKGYTGKITFVKTDATGNKKLEDAEFKVYTKDGDTVKYATFEEKDGALVFAGYVDSEDEATTLVTDKNGEIVITGLEDVTYYFHETKAPKGYALNPVDEVVEAVAENGTLETVGDATTLVYLYTGDMQDSQLAQLPFTGGTGTYVFTILGVLIMVVAAVLYFRAKKK